MKKSTVIEYFGSQYRLAKALTDAGFPISQPAVSSWPDEIPEKRAYQLERITKGALKFQPPEKAA
ncbi:MAG: Cro/CI family transcriptional regulator [Pontibacterium sp.]